MRCINCGNEVNQGDNFCQSCGAIINIPEQRGESGKNKWVKPLVITTAAAAIAVAVIYTIAFFTAGSSTPPPSEYSNTTPTQDYYQYDILEENMDDLYDYYKAGFDKIDEEYNIDGLIESLLDDINN